MLKMLRRRQAPHGPRIEPAAAAAAASAATPKAKSATATSPTRRHMPTGTSTRSILSSTSGAGAGAGAGADAASKAREEAAQVKAAAAAAAAKDADAVESWFYDEYAGSAQVLRRDGSSELVPATDEGDDGDDPYAANEEEDEALFGSTDFEAMMRAADKRPPGLPFVCLDLSACTAIADAGLIHVARVSPQLQQLRLQLCDQVRQTRALGAAGAARMVVCLSTQVTLLAFVCTHRLPSHRVPLPRLECTAPT